MKLAKSGQNSTRLGLTSTQGRCDFDHMWFFVGQPWTSSAESFLQFRAAFGKMRTGVDQLWADLNQVWTKADDHWPEFGLIRCASNQGKIDPTSKSLHKGRGPCPFLSTCVSSIVRQRRGARPRTAHLDNARFGQQPHAQNASQRTGHHIVAPPGGLASRLLDHFAAHAPSPFAHAGAHMRATTPRAIRPA